MGVTCKVSGPGRQQFSRCAALFRQRQDHAEINWAYCGPRLCPALVRRSIFQRLTFHGDREATLTTDAGVKEIWKSIFATLACFCVKLLFRRIGKERKGRKTPKRQAPLSARSL